MPQLKDQLGYTADARPVRAYHLTSAAYALNNIALQRLRISRLGDLNDPFELLAMEQSEREFRKGIASWKEHFHKRFGLLCFSRSWKNPVLWSHYGEKHRGVCLGFDLHGSIAMEVNYVKARLPLRFTNDDQQQGLDEGFVNELLRTKFEHWVYEDEVRVFLELDEGDQEGGNYFYPFDSDFALREIILGPACDVNIGKMRSLAKLLFGESVVVRKARLAFHTFDVVADQRHEIKG